MTFGVANIDRSTLINNVTLLAKVAKQFNLPAVGNHIALDWTEGGGRAEELTGLESWFTLPGTELRIAEMENGRCDPVGCVPAIT